jgi:hypothetical protein
MEENGFFEDCLLVAVTEKKQAVLLPRRRPSAFAGLQTNVLTRVLDELEWVARVAGPTQEEMRNSILPSTKSMLPRDQ